MIVLKKFLSMLRYNCPVILMYCYYLGNNLNEFDRILFMNDGELLYNLPYIEIKDKKELLSLQNTI